MEIKGVFLIEKPVGVTSHDVVARLRKVTGEKRIGHAGTLDPLASGLMIVAISREYTKQLDGYRGLDKEYEAEVTLGANTSTYDAEGEREEISNEQPTRERIDSTVSELLGKQMQMPPIFSAKKIKGQSAHRLARAGEEVKLEPKEIEIYAIDVLAYEYPVLRLRIRVSSGTYIRSLAYDLGQKLATGAYLSGLVRTQIGDYLLQDAIKLDEIKGTEDIMKAGIT